MNETLFYVLGICLVVLAGIVTFIGLRDSEAFSSRTLTRAAILGFVVLVAGTTTFAVLQARDEQADRRAELAAEEAEAGKAQKQGGGAEIGGANVNVEGKQVFSQLGCVSCHTLAAADASATVGPNLDQVLPTKSETFIRESIVKPNAEVAQGYPSNVMPQNFSQQLSPDQLNVLVKFLATNAGK